MCHFMNKTTEYLHFSFNIKNTNFENKNSTTGVAARLRGMWTIAP